MENEAVSEFLKLYAQLESSIRIKCDFDPSERNTSAVYWAENQEDFAVQSHVLKTLRTTRNLLDHPESCEGEYPVTPSSALISVLKEAIRAIGAPRRAGEMGVRFEKIYWATLDDCVLPAMRKMEECAFTHIPILEDRRVVGVFSENTLLSHIIKNEISLIEETTVFSDMGDLLPMEAHASETFGFISKDALASEVSAEFQNAFRKGERLGMLFVTANGKQDERLLGIITAWDVAALL